MCKLGWRLNKPETSEGPTATFTQMLCVGDSCGHREQEVMSCWSQCEAERKQSRREEKPVGLSFLREQELTLRVNINLENAHKFWGRKEMR